MECNPELERAEAELQERFRRECQQNQRAMKLSRKFTNILLVRVAYTGAVGLLYVNSMRVDPGSDAGMGMCAAGFVIFSFMLSLIMTVLVALF